MQKNWQVQMQTTPGTAVQLHVHMQTMNVQMTSLHVQMQTMKEEQ